MNVVSVQVDGSVLESFRVFKRHLLLHYFAIIWTDRMTYRQPTPADTLTVADPEGNSGHDPLIQFGFRL